MSHPATDDVGLGAVFVSLDPFWASANDYCPIDAYQMNQVPWVYWPAEFVRSVEALGITVEIR